MGILLADLIIGDLGAASTILMGYILKCGLDIFSFHFSHKIYNMKIMCYLTDINPNDIITTAKILHLLNGFIFAVYNFVRNHQKIVFYFFI